MAARFSSYLSPAGSEAPHLRASAGAVARGRARPDQSQRLVRIRRLAVSLMGVVLVVGSGLTAAAPANATCNATPNGTAITFTKPFPNFHAPAGLLSYPVIWSLTNTGAYSQGCNSEHTGNDWDLQDGDQNKFPVYAVTSGVVIKAVATDTGLYGRYMAINDQNDTNEFAVAHLLDLCNGCGAVDPGAEYFVGSGELIGWAGSSGSYAEFTHVHVSFTPDWNGWGSGTDFFSPRQFLSAHGVTWTYAQEPH